jgi:8-oxo-dGTP diphosphatase
MPAGEDGERLHCPACGLVVYDNPAPTASALVVREGALLLTRRAREPLAGQWDVPGGFIEPMELPEQTVRRELLEETGLEVEVGELLGIHLDRYGDDGAATLNLFYAATVAGGRERPADDVSEIGWFPLAGLDPAMVAFASGRAAIEQFVAKA